MYSYAIRRKLLKERLPVDMTTHTVIHKSFGEGTVTDHNGTYLTISFLSGEKKFVFPDAFHGFLKAKDPALSEQIEELLKKAQEEKQRLLQEDERKKEIARQQKSRVVESRSAPAKTKSYPRANIAFKCNFCDGGQSEHQVGFNGVCSDKLIRNNITVEKRTWCNADECPCLRYLNREITRQELDSLCEGESIVCYESQMLRNWRALAGVVQNGENKGKPMKLNQVQSNSLCVLTTRDPQSTEESRYIFAVFLVDETYEGDGQEAGYVGTKSRYRIKLSPPEARSLLFWNYHANENKSEIAAWSSGLHRYFEDEQAAQILRNISEIKAGTADEQLASEFYEHFCRVNGIDTSGIGQPSGALKIVSRRSQHD